MLTQGQRVLGYTLQEVIGDGGMATVYRATNPLGKQRAIKVLKPEYSLDADIRQRFEQEAKIMVELGEHSTHICQVENLDISEDDIVLVMEYLQGQDLADYIYEQGAVSPHQMIEWLEPVLQAIGYAHKKGVVHRDLKPSNLFLTTGSQVKVLDFGIAKVLTSGKDLTLANNMLGSPSFMSPEQIQTPKKVDSRSDIYALGVTMWTLLAGKNPYEEVSEFVTQTKIVKEPLPLLTGEAELFNSIIQKATAKSVDARYMNCQLLAEDLTAALKPSDGKDSPEPHPDEPPIPPVEVEIADNKPIDEPIGEADPLPELKSIGWWSRYKRAVYGVGLVLILAGLAVGYWAWPQQEAPSRTTEPAKFIPFKEGSQYGVKDRSGKVILSAQSMWVDSLRDEAVLVRLGTHRYRILGPDGQWRSGEIDGTVDSFSEGLAVVEKNDKYGYIDKTGTFIIPVEFDDAKAFNEGVARVKKDTRWGYIDKTGKPVTAFEFNNASSFSEGVARVAKGIQWGYIDKTGKTIINFQFEDAESFSQGLAKVKKGNKWGYIDKTGKTIIPFEFDGAKSFSEGLAQVVKGVKYGYIDKTGKAVVDFQYDGAESFNDGLAVVKKGSKWGFIDKTGKPIIPFEFDHVNSEKFDEELAVVAKGSKWGYIDKTGNTRIPLAFDHARPFSEGLAKVKKGDKYGYIDKTGASVIPFEFEVAHDFSQAGTQVVKAGRTFYIDRTGREIQ